MAEAFRVLGQVAPAANIGTLSNLFTVPATTEYVVSTITVCNRSGTAAAKFRIAVSPDGAAIAPQHYLYYDANLGPQATVAITIGVTCDAGDVLRVSSDTADVSFSAFGTVVTP